ncbi:MAG: sensor histidine kinase [Alphaproteobacteria bacterium]
MATATERFAKLSTPTKLLLILSAALLPIGLILMWVANDGIREANAALKAQSDDHARIAARSIESLVARNALALRIAANGMVEGPDPCDRVRRSLAIAPAVAQRFVLSLPDGTEKCRAGDLGEIGPTRPLAPGAIALNVSPGEEEIVVRAGIIGGIATTVIPIRDIRAAALEGGGDFNSIIIRDGRRQLDVMTSNSAIGANERPSRTTWPIGSGRLAVEIEGRVPTITTFDRVVILLPVAMWFIAALMTWLLVGRLLVQPLRRLQRAVSRYEPGDAELELPRKLGPATEIQELRDAFARAVSRVEESERDMTAALEGQRRLVREVHHRVKNNLQVIASLLNIHGRTAETEPAREAYSSIGRRVGALAIVHRNHYAEMEEKRGISMRPLLAELVAELRAGAPDSARRLAIDLDVEPLHTTQDVAVSVAFLVTEVIEFAMFHRPEEPVEISVGRTSELTGRMTIASPVLVPDSADNREKQQFERIIAGLAKQLRSTLERKLGRYSVDLPVFPGG